MTPLDFPKETQYRKWNLSEGSLMSEAIFDPTRTYRYRLTRLWGTLLEDKGTITWIMLNPSTADEFQDDPTIRRCIGFSKQWGFSRLIITNLYGLRSTDPKQLLLSSNPIGDDNLYHIKKAVEESQFIMAAWGAFQLGIPQSILPTLKNLELHCLGTTKSGQPKHPLYIKADTNPIRLIL